VEQLFGSDFTSGPGRIVVRVCTISLFVAIIVGRIGTALSDRLSDGWMTALTGVVVISALTFLATFIALGVRVVGKSAGKKTWAGQAKVTFDRVFLFLLLPCLLFAIGSVVWMILNGRI